MYTPGIPGGDSSEKSRPCSIPSLRPHIKQTWALAAPCPPLVKQELTCTMPVLFASILTNVLSYALGLSQALCSTGVCICRNKWEKKAVLLFQQMHVKCSWKCYTSTHSLFESRLMWYSVLGKEKRWNILFKCICFLNSCAETQCSLYLFKN